MVGIKKIDNDQARSATRTTRSAPLRGPEVVPAGDESRGTTKRGDHVVRDDDRPRETDELARDGPLPRERARSDDRADARVTLVTYVGLCLFA